LAKKIGDFKQMYTQSGGIRPFGASLLIGGVDHDGPQVYVTHPSGAVYEYKAYAMGQNGKAVNDVLEKRHSSVRSLDDCIALSLEALGGTIEGGVTKENVEMALIRTETAKFEKVPDEVIAKHIMKR